MAATAIGRIEIHCLHVPNAANGWVKPDTLKAVRAGHSAVEIPIRFEERTEGVSKMNLSTQIESAVMPVRLRLRNRRG